MELSLGFRGEIGTLETPFASDFALFGSTFGSAPIKAALKRALADFY
jgi:hypothetical protein